MRFASRLAAAAAFAIAPLSHAHAQNAGKTLAMDFNMTNVITGVPDTGRITGHAVGSAEKMRLEVQTRGSNAQLNPMAMDSSVTMIVSDSGKTITYLDSKKSQFLRVKPAEMVAQAQKSGAMKMEFSGTDAKVDSLGAGPAILGHPTSHYRLTTGMTMTISAMGQQHTVKIASTNDTYYATDINENLNPFASLTGGDLANMFGTTNKEFADKMKAAQNRLPRRTPLRALNSATMTSEGQTRVTNTAAEATAVQWVPADPKVFEVPATYKAVPVPTMGESSGAIPPN